MKTDPHKHRAWLAYAFERALDDAKKELARLDAILSRHPAGYVYSATKPQRDAQAEFVDWLAREAAPVRFNQS